ncbi:hypothetical protein OS493_013632 [Desmophyllum pertusum]|uniref:XPG-I domain-containing protein n=1 Tax=Desmophyllum pertusum TaxID=174260 RepID=A0A9X0A2H4_9CNID|nr:hypothetical protein OS493_013632 [Desmophyllum pertusum]
MVFHLNCLLMWKFWKFVFLVSTYPLQKLCGINVFDDDIDSSFNAEPLDTEKRCGLCSKTCKAILLLLVFPVWAVTITTAFLLYVLPVTYVAFRIWKMLFRIEIESQCCQNIPSFVKITSFPILYILFIVFCMCVEAAYFMLGVTFTVNIMFLGSVAGFTIMGLLFYIDVYLPYIVLGSWVVMYMLRATNKYYAQFTLLRTIVFEECEKLDAETRTEASIRESFSGPVTADRRAPSLSSLPRHKSMNFLVIVDDYGVPSIPLDIFLASSHQLMPFKRIILAKLLKVIALGSYLVVIFLFVRSLMEFNAASTAVQGLALLLLGGLPLLAQSQGHNSEAEEIRARFYVKDFIKQYTKRAFAVLIKSFGVPCIESTGEAEALCAWLDLHQIVDGCITNDGDAFLYGARTVYKDLCISGKDASVQCYKIEEIETKLNLNRQKLVALGILLGCDYLPQGVAGVGKQKAMKLIKMSITTI